jgi:hypothetical protein
MDFRLERFERVDASAGTALLRVLGEWDGAETPELLIDDGRERRRVRALPDPSGGAGGLRAAFPVPSALLGSGSVAFALVSQAGELVADLPRPVAPGQLERLTAERDDLRGRVESLEMDLARGAAAGDAGELEQRVAMLEAELDSVSERYAGAQEVARAALEERMRLASELERAQSAELQVEALEQSGAEFHVEALHEDSRADRPAARQSASRAAARHNHPAQRARHDGRRVAVERGVAFGIVLMLVVAVLVAVVVLGLV